MVFRSFGLAWQEKRVAFLQTGQGWCSFATVVFRCGGGQSGPQFESFIYTRRNQRPKQTDIDLARNAPLG
jgi:hypothetical protein